MWDIYTSVKNQKNKLHIYCAYPLPIYIWNNHFHEIKQHDGCHYTLALECTCYGPIANRWAVYKLVGQIVNRPARLKAGQLVQMRQEAGRDGLKAGWPAKYRACTCMVVALTTIGCYVRVWMEPFLYDKFPEDGQRSTSGVIHRAYAEQINSATLYCSICIEILRYWCTSLHTHVEDWLAQSRPCAQLPCMWVRCKFVFCTCTRQLCVHW